MSRELERLRQNSRLSFQRTRDELEHGLFFSTSADHLRQICEEYWRVSKSSSCHTQSASRNSSARKWTRTAELKFVIRARELRPRGHNSAHDFRARKE